MNDDLVVALGTPHPKPCKDCGSTLILLSGPFGPYYGCVRYPKCQGTAKAHGDGRVAADPATEIVRGKRVYAHAIYDHLWKVGYMDRNEAGDWAKEITGVRHIGEMDARQLELLVREVFHYRRTHSIEHNYGKG